MNYYFSAGYDNNKGVILGDDFDRISLLGKLKTDITSWLEVGLDGSLSQRDYSGAHGSWVNASMASAQTMSPYGVMFRDDEGNLEKYPYTQSSVNPLWGLEDDLRDNIRSEEHTSELQSLMRISYAVFCLKTKTKKHTHPQNVNYTA